MNKNLSKNLKRIRIENGYTQKEFADKLGIAKSTVCMYETGSREPTIDTILKICRIFSCTAQDLLDGDDTFKAITKTDIFQNKDGSRYEKTETVIDLTDRAKFIDCYDNMNKIGQREALKRVSEMTRLEEYTIKPRKAKLENVSDEELKQNYKYYPPDAE